MSILAVTSTDHKTVYSRNMFGDLINNANDEQLVKYILKTFPKQGPRIYQDESSNENLYASSFIASDMQLLIDMDSAKDVMTQLRLITVHNAFRNIDNVDTLKLLLTICHDISSSNTEGWNYLHFAVCQGKVDWVEYLLENGHDIHHKDRIGCTPLLAISWLRPVDISRVLVRRGANIYYVNYHGDNVAQMILQFSMYYLQPNLFAWIDYTVENRYEKLWNVANMNGITAFEQLYETILAEDSAQPLAMSTETLLFIFSDQYRANLNQFRGSGSLDLSNWTKLVFPQKLNLQNINSNVKNRLLRGSIESGTDKQFVQLLLLLFPRRMVSRQDQAILQTDYHQGSLGCEYFQAEAILPLINLSKADQHFRKLNLVYCNKIFTNIKELETLKLICGICPDFTQCTRDGINYLQIASILGNSSWVVYLIKAGYDVNQKDEDNDTPLMDISPKHALVMTKLLIENGAIPYLVDKWGLNVAHRLFLHISIPEEEHVVYEWVEYMLEQNYDAIWTAKDTLQYPGTTPLEMLSKMLGADHPTTKSVYFRLGHEEQVFSWDEQPYKQDFSLLERSPDSESKWTYSDDKFIQMLLNKFGKCDKDKCRCTSVNSKNVKSKGSDWSPHVHDLLAEEILECIDVTQARETFSEVKLGNLFLENINSIETLKVLMNICPDFKLVNSQGGNYLHYAVRHGRVQWIEYLISLGYDVNERDKHGFTPLLCISPKYTLEAARLLVEKGCNVLVTANDGENFVQKLKRQYDWCGYLPLPNELIAFMEEKGYGQLLL